MLQKYRRLKQQCTVRGRQGMVIKTKPSSPEPLKPLCTRHRVSQRRCWRAAINVSEGCVTCQPPAFAINREVPKVSATSVVEVTATKENKKKLTFTDL